MKDEDRGNEILKYFLFLIKERTEEDAIMSIKASCETLLLVNGEELKLEED